MEQRFKTLIDSYAVCCIMLEKALKPVHIYIRAQTIKKKRKAVIVGDTSCLKARCEMFLSACSVHWFVCVFYPVDLF